MSAENAMLCKGLENNGIPKYRQLAILDNLLIFFLEALVELPMKSMHAPKLIPK